MKGELVDRAIQVTCSAVSWPVALLLVAILAVTVVHLVLYSIELQATR